MDNENPFNDERESLIYDFSYFPLLEVLQKFSAS
jgi:hypothetical protein